MSHKTAPGIGQIIKPIEVRQISKFIAEVVYFKYGNRNVLISKMSPRLKSMMV